MLDVNTAARHEALRAALALGDLTLSDPGIGLFHTCLSAGAPMAFEPGMRILEIGCCEADWLSEARRAWPEIDLVGIDTRAVTGGRGDTYKADAMDTSVFPAESFDGIVSLSAIEHIGLGHYGDPVDPDGDTKAMANVFRWLKPGGWVYFDVPYDPTGYQVKGTECRVYDDDALFERLWMQPLADAKARARWLWDGYVHAKAVRELLDKPTVAAQPFYYRACVFRKVG